MREGQNKPSQQPQQVNAGQPGGPPQQHAIFDNNPQSNNQQVVVDPSQQQQPPQMDINQQQIQVQQYYQQQQPMQSQQTPGGGPSGGDFGGNNSVNQRFKTQKCRHFENKGFCQWNENCQYAHGDGELRDINDPIPEHMRTQASRRVAASNRGMDSGNQRGAPSGHQSQGGYNSGGGRGGGGGYHNRGSGGYSRGGGDTYHSGYQSRGGQGGPQGAAGGYQQYNGGAQGGGYYQQNGGSMGRGSSRGGGMGHQPRGGQMGGGMYPESDDFQGVRRQGRGGGRGGYQGTQTGGPQQNTGFKNHKTVICKHFNAGKTCPYQNNCTYAHGLMELRQPINGGGSGQQHGGGGQGMYQSKQHQQQQPYMGQPMAIQGYPQTGPAMYGGLIQQVGIPGQMGTPQIFGEPTIIYGEPGGPHQRYDYPGGQGGYDQQAVAQQQMLVNNQGNPAAGMAPMYMAAGVQQPGGMMAMQQPMVQPVQQTQIVINSTSDDADGQPIQTQRILTIFIVHNTQEVQDQIRQATELSDGGNYEQALRILSQLHEAQKISMQETATQNFGDPQDLTYMQPQQQPQNEAQTQQETAGHK